MCNGGCIRQFKVDGEQTCAQPWLYLVCVLSEDITPAHANRRPEGSVNANAAVTHTLSPIEHRVTNLRRPPSNSIHYSSS